MMMPTKRTVLLYAFLILVAMLPQLWIGAYSLLNFESDQAIFGLMTKHIAVGKVWPVYIYGEHYSGSLITILSAPLLRLFGTSSVMALRATSLLLFVPIFGLFAWIVEKHWGRRMAVITLLLTAAPGWLLMNFTVQPSANFAIRALCTYGVFALWMLRPTSQDRKLLQALAGGLVLGIGIWTHPSFLLSVAVMAGLWLLGSADWKHAMQTRGFPIVLKTLLLVTLLGFAISLFPGQFPVWHLQAKTTSRIAALALCVLLFLLSPRKKALLIHTSVFGLGTVLGNAPQLVAKMFFGLSVNQRLTFLWPTWPSVRGLLATVFPLQFGVIPVPLTQAFSLLPMTLQICWVLMMGCVVWSLGFFLWKHRGTCMRLVLFRPLHTDDRVPAFCILTFWMFAIALLGTLNSEQSYGQVRQLIISWLPAMVMLAYAFHAFIKQKKWIGIGLLCLYVGFVSYQNIHNAYLVWGRGADFNDVQLAGLERYLKNERVEAVYGNFWNSFAFDFLLDERIIFAPYDSKDAYPEYSKTALCSHRYAIIVHPHLHMRDPAPTDVKGLLARAKTIDLSIAAYPHVIAKWERSRLISITRIERWTLWILEDPRPETSEQTVKKTGTVLPCATF